LLARLGAAARGSAILVSAPAGYGKSTLVSSWLEERDRLGAWVSLDESDNDLQRFLGYLVGAVETLFPDAVGDTHALIASPTLPPTPVVMATLVNELDRIEEEFILVLDDIHVVRDEAVRDCLGQILRRPPRSMQLVLVGRRDPVLPLASLRAKGRLTELRMRDLRFSAAEAVEFLRAASRQEIGQGTATEVAEKAEGWVTGLRLAVLAMRGMQDTGRRLLELKGTTRYVADYLVTEVLDRQPQGLREALLRTAILERFCAPLCDALVAPGETAARGAFDGQALIDWLLEGNLFTIPLDTENRWFRYHHLFGELLRTQLERAVGPDEMAALHSRAAAWCEAHGLVLDSLRHALEAGDPEGAADIVERHQDAEFDANRWHLVARWLELVPDEVKRQRPKLLLSEARVLNDRFRLADIPPLVELAQALLAKRPAAPLVQGELYYFLGFLQFWLGDGRASRAYLDRALELVPDDHSGYVRAQLELFSGLAAHIDGQGEAAVERLSSWIDSRGLRSGLVWQRLTFGLATIHLLGGAMESASRSARALFEDGRRTHSRYIEVWGKYLLGVAAFHRHDLAAAEQHFNHVVANRYVANTRAAIDSMGGIALTAQLLGRPDEADAALRLAHDHAQWSEDPMHIEVALACEARIALLRGDLEAAARWQRGLSVPSNVPGTVFFLTNPCITECRVLAALDSEAALTDAAAKLQRLRQESTAIHYTNQTMEIVVLQAMVADRQGRSERALDLVQEAVDLAGLEGWTRPFVELGPPMADLLGLLVKRDPAGEGAAEILRAFPDGGDLDHLQGRPHRPAGSQPVAEPLTYRELDVLELLCKRLQNKEIAERLSISPLTVKTHLQRIYQKLRVSKRREAVEKARALRILG